VLETLVYLTVAVAVTAILAVIAPPGTPLPHLIVAVGVLTVLLAAARHRPTAIAAALDAITRLLGR
jgi:hypothetical protein